MGGTIQKELTEVVHAMKQPAGLPEPSSLAAALLRAFAKTEHRVLPCPGHETVFVLKVGECSRPVSVLHWKFGVNCSAFLSSGQDGKPQLVLLRLALVRHVDRRRPGLFQTQPCRHNAGSRSWCQSMRVTALE